MTAVVTFVIVMAVLCCFAVFGTLVVFAPRETGRQRIQREARAAEARIISIARQAQAAIIAEAIRRATDPNRR